MSTLARKRENLRRRAPIGFSYRDAFNWLRDRLETGTITMSVAELAAIWGWPRSRTSSYLHELQDIGVLSLHRSGRSGLLITTGRLPRVGRGNVVPFPARPRRKAPADRRARSADRKRLRRSGRGSVSRKKRESGVVYVMYAPDLKFVRLKVGFSDHLEMRQKTLSGGAVDHHILFTLRHDKAYLIEQVAQKLLDEYRARNNHQFGKERFDAPRGMGVEKFLGLVKNAIYLAKHYVESMPSFASDAQFRAQLAEATKPLLGHIRQSNLQLAAINAG
jgi:hypothetical protein